METGWKVISGTKVGRPATTNALQRVRYSLTGEWTYQPDDAGPLAVFETQIQAERFMLDGYGSQLWECEFEQSSEEKLWKKNPPTFVRNPRSMRRAGMNYHAESAGVTSLDLNECPDGTVLARKVRLIRRVTQ